jgi:hypothetical protein
LLNHCVFSELSEFRAPPHNALQWQPAQRWRDFMGAYAPRMRAVMSAARPHTRTPVIAAVLALLSSCAVGPQYHKPQAPANPGYAPTPLPTSSASAPVPGGGAQHLIGDQEISFGSAT